MAGLFIFLYLFFRKQQVAFYAFLVVVVSLILFFASRIRFEENISGISGTDEKLQLDEYVIRNFRFAEKIVIHLRASGTAGIISPEKLTEAADTLGKILTITADPSLIRTMTVRIDDTLAGYLQSLVMKHLPVFLDETDYPILDSLADPSRIPLSVASVYRIMVTPAGMAMRNHLLTDPMGFAGPALQKLRSLQVSRDFTLYDGYVVTPDLRHLLIFLTPANPPGETSGNSRLVYALDQVIGTMKVIFPEVRIDYFGSPAVAAGNAERIRNDILLTLIIALVSITLFIGLYYRNFLIPLMSFLPALFGAGLALAIISAVKGTMSVIALGIGSVMLGLIVDYARYIINHYLLRNDPVSVLKDMSDTIMMCAITSAAAFLCLVFLDSAVLHDLGWFAAISVTGAALFALVILPQFPGAACKPVTKVRFLSVIDRISDMDLSKMKWIVIPVALIILISLLFSRKPAFEENMNSLNYMSPELAGAQAALEQIAPSSLKNVYIVATGSNMESALPGNQRVRKGLERLHREGIVHEFSGIGAIWLPENVQAERIGRWNDFWKDERGNRLLNVFMAEAREKGFSAEAFASFDSLLNKNYQPVPAQVYDNLARGILGEWIHQTPELAMISTVARTDDTRKQKIYEAFENDSQLVVFDRLNLTGRFIKGVRADFNLLINLSMVFVTLLLLISFGRIELGIMAAIPMFAAWAITLGFMAATGIRFNIFNIIVSSFIFGLGVDYSILMANGMLKQYRTGKDEMPTYRLSILLSSATTIIGTSALFFARHPALHSIALISVAGMLSVVLVTLVIEPLPARWFLIRQQERKNTPIQLRHVLYSIFVAWIPITTIAIILVIYGSLISPLLPVTKKRKQELFHRIFATLSRGYIALNFRRHNILMNTGGEDFREPALIVSNHQSLIETPALLRLHPGILIMTNPWVFRHFVFGPVARLAGFIPVMEHIDQTAEVIRKRIREGYSILIFPEAHRSPDGHIQRFHRGAFYIAEKLQADLLPVVIFGSGDYLRKGNFWGRPGRLYMKILPRIKATGRSFGDTYQERARYLRQYYRAEYAALKQEAGGPGYYAPFLQQSYLFKGPVLEWYVRVKMKLEENFIHYHRLLPLQGDILDLGCGYGYITLMLMLCSDDRNLTGVDYDEDKILVAENSYLINKRIRFVHADVMLFDITPSDGILLGDTLHYLTPEDQQTLLARCAGALKPGGVLLIREADAGMQRKHRRSKLTEFFSTRGGFNKTRDDHPDLHFTSETILRDFAQKSRLSFGSIDT